MSKWIKTEDRLPKQGVPVITYNPNRHIGYKQLTAMYIGDRFRDVGDFDETTHMVGVTHWRPMPKPPKLEEEQKSNNILSNITDSPFQLTEKQMDALDTLFGLKVKQ